MTKETKKQYIGITLGPIVATTNMTSSPAGLWAASYMFSFLTRTICENLIKEGVKSEQIISPYYDSGDRHKKDGVGRYHDHIIVRSDKDSEDLQTAADAVNQAKEELKALFKDSDDHITDFSEDDLDSLINSYIRISLFKFTRNDNETAIDASTDMFNCIELPNPIMPPSESNPLLSLFDNRENDKTASDKKNELIKKSKLVQQETADGWQLLKGKGIKTLEDIAKCGRTDGLKSSEYYVILRSDGDSMSKVIQTCRDDSAIRSFSKRCIEYCDKAAQTVKEYGGITIYSGGDDLLAIVPVCSDKEARSGRYKNIFDLISEIGEKFSEAFATPIPYTEKDGSPHKFSHEEIEAYKNNVKPTLSFGAAVCYCKFPLYEALQISADMLFNVAKQKKAANVAGMPVDKNFTVITFRKNSGQTETMLIKNGKSMEKLIELFNKVYIGKKKSPAFLSSIGHKLYDFDELFKKAAEFKGDSIKNVFDNTFDSEIHKDNSFITEACVDLFKGLCEHDEQHQIYALLTLNQAEKKKYDADELTQKKCGYDYYCEPSGINTTFDYIFRIIKFFGEKARKEVT